MVQLDLDGKDGVRGWVREEGKSMCNFIKSNDQCNLLKNNNKKDREKTKLKFP